MAKGTEVAPTSAGGAPDPESLPGLDVRREGGAFLYLWRHHGYGIEVSQLHENSDGLTGEIRVERLQPAGGRPARVFWGKINLSSSRSREEAQKKIAVRTGKIGLDWDRVVEYVASATADGWRQGEPFVDLAHIPSRLHVTYLVDRLLPDGETVGICADGGSGKGWVAILLAIGVLTGRSLPGGLRVHRSAPVLYLDWEESATETRRRLEWLSRGLGIEVPHLHYRRMERPLYEEVGRVQTEIARLGIGLVIVDSIVPATGGEPKDTLPTKEVMGAIRALAPATRLFLGHITKAEAAQTNGRARIYGNVFYGNLARSVWEVRCQPDAGNLRLGFYHNKSNISMRFPPFGLQLLFDDAAAKVEVLSQEVTETPELAKRADTPYLLRQALSRGKRTMEELTKAVGRSEGTVRAALKGMSDVSNDEGVGRGNKSYWYLVAQEDMFGNDK